MKLIYPACFYADSDEKDVYTVIFPDLPGAITEGKTLIEAIEMAQDCGCGWIAGVIEDGEKIPKPSSINNVKADEYENGFVNLVMLDIDAFDEKNGKKAIRKNCTIPAWLNTIAENNGVNFSKVLQEALIKEFDL